MTDKSFVSKVRQKISLSLLSLCFLSVLLFSSVSVPPALADTGFASIEGQNLLIADGTMEGIGDQVKGKVDETLGRTKREFSGVRGQTEGALQESAGKARQGMGKTKVSADRAGDKAKRTLDRASDRTEDASGNLMDKVKGIFN